MEQLELFNREDDMTYAMSLTLDELRYLKQHNPNAYNWVNRIRHAIYRYNSTVQRATHERDLSIAGIDLSIAGIRLRDLAIAGI